MVMVSINYFSKSEHFYISIVFVSVQNKKVTGGSTLGSAIKNLGLFSKSHGDLRIEKMDF